MIDNTNSAQDKTLILIVEDSLTQAEKLRFLLQQAGYDVLVAEDGLQALELFRTQKPALVISDILMPHRNGYELCRQIREEETLFNTPVILLTSLSGPEDIIDGLSAGADSFITKPYNAAYLLKHVEQTLNSDKDFVRQTEKIEFDFKQKDKWNTISANPQRMVSLMLSTYEAAVYRHSEVQQAQADLGLLNERLEDLVEERTASLTAEIAERQSAQTELQISESRLREVLENSQNVSYKRNAQSNNYDYLSPVITLLTGYTVDEMQSLTMDSYINLIHPDDQPEVNRVLDSSMASSAGRRYQLEYRFKTKSGVYCWIHDKYTVNRGADGKIFALIGTLSDITERKQAEEARRTSEARIAAVFRLSPYVIGVSTLAEGRFIEVNDAFEDVLGYSRAETLGRTSGELGLWVDEEVRPTILREIQSNGFVKNLEINLKRKSGQVFPALGSMAVVYLQNVPCIITMVTDITERKQMEEQLKQSEAKLKALFEALPVGVAVYNAENNMSYVNPALEKILGIKLDSLLRGEHKRRRYLRKDGTPMLPNEFASVRAHQEQQAINNVETGMVKEDGQVVWTEANAVPVNFSDWSIVMALTDITDRKKAENDLREAHSLLERRVLDRTAELRTANVELEKSSRLKDEFLASMSHELRTPLVGILGLSEVMQLPTSEPLTPKQHSHLNNIHKSGQQLLELINQILDYSLIETGKFELSLAPLSLAVICQDCLKMITPLATAKKMQASFTMFPESIQITADARRIKQILTHLLENAIKFTPAEGSFGMDVQGSREDSQVVITIWDTGIGIAPEDIPHLFQPFSQLDARLARKYNGIGIGLVLARGLAELHKGSVSVQSTLGIGSRFSVTLPWDGQPN